MVKIWNGSKWIEGRIEQGANVFVLPNPTRFIPIDQDGFVRFGSVKYRIFSAEAKEPHYYAMKA